MSANAEISPQNFSSVNIKTGSLLQKKKQVALTTQQIHHNVSSSNDELELVQSMSDESE